LVRLTAADNPQEALSVARQLGEREPHKLTSMLLEGDVLAQSGKTDDALKQFSKAAKAGADPQASLRVVSVLDRAQRGVSADEEMANLVRRFPQEASVLGFAAQRALAQGKTDKGVELLQKVADQNPNNPIVLNDLAWAQIRAKNSKALNNAIRASQLMPDNPNVLDTLGMAQALAGRRDDAIASLRTAVNLVPRAALPRLHLATQLLAAGNLKEAQVVLAAVERNQLSSSELQEFDSLIKTLKN